MDFPRRAGEREHHPYHDCSEAADLPSGYYGYGYEPYPPEGFPPHHHHQAPRLSAPAAPSSGPYGTHAPSGPYYPRPHQEAPFCDAARLPFTQSRLGCLPQGQLVRVFCKQNPAFNLAVERDSVIMKAADTQDEAHQWIKDDSYGMRIKDNYGHSAFALVNKKTGKVLQHAKQKGQQVLLMDYQPDLRDDDILWSASQDFGEDFKTIRCASNTLLNLTVFEGQKTVRNGSALVLDTWHKGDHQLWKLFPL